MPSEVPEIPFVGAHLSLGRIRAGLSSSPQFQEVSWPCLCECPLCHSTYTRAQPFLLLLADEPGSFPGRETLLDPGQAPGWQTRSDPSKGSSSSVAMRHPGGWLPLASTGRRELGGLDTGQNRSTEREL